MVLHIGDDGHLAYVEPHLVGSLAHVLRQHQLRDRLGVLQECDGFLDGRGSLTGAVVHIRHGRVHKLVLVYELPGLQGRHQGLGVGAHCIDLAMEEVDQVG